MIEKKLTCLFVRQGNQNMIGIGRNSVDPGLKKLTALRQLPPIQIRNAQRIARVLIIRLLAHIQHLLVNHRHQETRLPNRAGLQLAHTHLDNIIQKVDLQSMIDHFQGIIVELQLPYQRRHTNRFRLVEYQLTTRYCVLDKQLRLV